MNITVKFFARYREALGVDSLKVEGDFDTVDDVRRRVACGCVVRVDRRDEVDAGETLIDGLLASAVAAFFYLRVVAVMYFQDGEESKVQTTTPLLNAGIVIMVVGVFAMGLFSGSIIDLADTCDLAARNVAMLQEMMQRLVSEYELSERNESRQNAARKAHDTTLDRDR